MKNNCHFFSFILFILFAASCQEAPVEPETVEPINLKAIPSAKKNNNTCTTDFYYYNQEKVILGSVLTSRIIIGFPDNFTSEQKAAFVARFAFLNGIESEYNTGSADATTVLLKNGLSCADVKAALAYLQGQPEVRYATPYYSSPDGAGSMGLTNQFIVNLKPASSLADLQQLANKTRTQVVEQLGDYTYIMSADKYANGNALEMANTFAVHNKVESSEPDFLYSYNSSNVIVGN